MECLSKEQIEQQIHTNVASGEAIVVENRHQPAQNEGQLSRLSQLDDSSREEIGEKDAEETKL